MIVNAHPARRTRWRYAVVLAFALTAAGCGSADHGRPVSHEGAVITASPAPTDASGAGTVVRVSFTTSSVKPSGAEVKTRVDEPVTFLITAPRAGQMHIHSSPEQMIDYPKGTSQATVRFTTPGVIDVESHTLDKLIVQLEVH